MRKFKFDIDDWTGGNTLSGSMGDEIGKTVNKYTFRVTSAKTNKVIVKSNTSIPIHIDWGDTQTELSTRPKYIVHNYTNNKEQNIKFTIADKYLDEFEDIGTDNLITCLFNITGYYVGNIKGFIYNFLSSTNGSFAIPIIVNDGVKTIGNYAFYNLRSSMFLRLPKTVNEINDWAFAYGSFTKGIELPDNISHIGQGAFSKCSIKNKNDFVLPSNLETLGKDAFNKCGIKGNLVIPNRVKSIPDYCFANNNLSSVKISDSVENIETRAFINNDRLKTLELGNNVKSIGRSAFNGVKLTGTLEIPSSVMIIHSFAFASCGLLNKLIFNEGIEHIGEYAFNSCANIETPLVLPESLKSVGKRAFQLCDRIKTLYVCEDTKLAERIVNGRTEVITYKKGNKPIIK